MKDEQAQRWARLLTQAASQILQDDLASAELTPEDRQKVDRFLTEDGKRQYQGVVDLLRELSFPSLSRSDLRNRADRIKNESANRRAFLTWAKKFVRKPAGGGRPRSTDKGRDTALVQRVAYFLSQGESRQDAFKRVADLFGTSPSTVRRRFGEFRKGSEKTRTRKKR